jgi:putative Ca2+/H+ antiporter (TMEM165/GDT1 family)
LGISFVLVALAEVGDRTQLLGLILSVKHRKPAAVLLGIFVATLANHLAAAAGGGAHAAAWIGLARRVGSSASVLYPSA